MNKINTSIISILNDAIKHCLEKEENNFMVCGKIGKIVDSESKKLINLPISNDAVLNDDPNVTFIEGISEKCAHQVIYEILLNSKEVWNVKNRTVSTIEYRSMDDSIILQNYSEKPILNNYGEVKKKCFHYIPNSARLMKKYIHFDIVVVSPSPLLGMNFVIGTSEGINNINISDFLDTQFTHCVYRNISAWDFFLMDDLFGEHVCTLVHSSHKDIESPNQCFQDYSTNTEFELDVSQLSHSFRIVLNPFILHNYYSIINDMDNNSKNPVTFLYNTLKNIRDMAYANEENAFDSDYYYYPTIFGDEISRIREHYDTKAIIKASGSRIPGLRKLNNQVKRCLIKKYVTQKASVLDLACGHGQDLSKYTDIGVAKYTGIDISSAEIQEAKNRMKSNALIPSITCNFFVGDVTSTSTLENLYNNHFDAISFQLAIHYCLSSKSMAQTILSNISKLLVDGGVFIGTTICCYKIIKHLSNYLYENYNSLNNEKDLNSKISFGNKLYSISFDSNSLSRKIFSMDNNLANKNSLLDSINKKLTEELAIGWGIKYHFWLIDHIDMEEYVVPWISFCDIAKQYNLKLIEHCSFPEFFADESTKNISLQEWIDKVLMGITKQHEETEIFDLYKVFIFQKETSSYSINLTQNTEDIISDDNYDSQISRIDLENYMGQFNCSNSTQTNSSSDTYLL